MINIKEIIAKEIEKVTKLNSNELESYIEKPKEAKNGDYAFPCFRLAKELKKAPQEIAKEIASNINISKEVIENVEVVGGYLNFYANKNLLTNEVIKEITEIEADAFVGPLISKRAVETVGFPKGELFIYGDDLEYTYRISRQFDTYLIKNAVINHRDQPSNIGVQKPNNWWKDYYMYRNRIFFVREFQKNKIKMYIGFILVRLRCTKQILLAYRLGYNKKLIKLRIATIRKAYKDGLKNKTGRTIEPVAYKNKVNELIK